MVTEDTAWRLEPDVVVADRFRLVAKIGQGGMGSVWRATHLGLDIPCAVKFIEDGYATAPDALARFEREAKAAAQLRSPHVVQILDHGLWAGRPYLAMELLEGEDLAHRLARLGRLPPGEVCTIVGQIGRALTKAHAAGIVHRDLKPDNVFMVHDDDREIAKVLDFGIAKATARTEVAGPTKTGSLLGTPLYMSPEQAQGNKTVDHRTDLWALAVIAYQALTGELPFESDALGDLVLKIVVGPLPVPSAVAPDLPAPFDRWWAKAASRDPELRYQSARELSESLAIALGQSQSGEWSRGLGVSDSGAKPIVVLGRSGEASSAELARTFEASTASPVPPRRNRALVMGAAIGLLALAGVGGALALGGKSKDAVGPGTPAASAAAQTAAASVSPPAAASTAEPAQAVMLAPIASATSATSASPAPSIDAAAPGARPRAVAPRATTPTPGAKPGQVDLGI